MFIKGNYINREYSWLLFNKRVLGQAADKNVPLLERAKFFSIFCSNLDEFYMVRVGGLTNQNALSPKSRENKTNLTASEQLGGIFAQTAKLCRAAGKVFADLRKDLKESGLRQVRNLTDKQKTELKKYFSAAVLPFLSPMALDAKHPLMRFENAHTYLILRLEKGGREMFGVLPMPAKVKPVYVFTGKKTAFITLEDTLKELGHLAFAGFKCVSRALVRVTRNADFETDEADCDSEYDYDFAKYMREKIEMRASFDAVRLQTDGGDETCIEFARKNLGLKEKQCFAQGYPLDCKYMGKLGDMLGEKEAARNKYPPFRPKGVREGDGSMIARVLRGDVFLSYPYDSFSTLVRLLEECAESKQVASIKITIYRLDNHSRIVEALKRASENGIEVTVVIELCARFDEENNMYYAEVLKEAGCTIFYGVGNYKVHSKIVSIVLETDGAVKYITHLGTGNYNEVTARLYTDLNIITANDAIGRDGAAFFRNLAIGNIEQEYEKLLIAPHSLKSGLLSYIDREIAKAERGEAVAITAKMNSLTDLEMIDRLIKAGKAGVRVNLIVRGICCLRPSLAGKTENIRVISIVGRFLEHSRIYAFGANGEDIFISSADLMTRNTDKRVEIATPVLDPDIKAAVWQKLATMLADNVKARQLHANGEYLPVPRAEGERIVNSQEDPL
ncbi:MAG: polyphosphate kinase 1 [Clostridiales bacterium]|nr:polyphosphate kinase 1 [Clostridiales bacterium]